MDIPTTSPAANSPSFEKLKLKLRELFELDKADLDFGIYRILRQRHREITEFLDRHLEKTVREALTSHGSLQQGHLEADLHAAESAAQAAGIAPEASPKVMELREKLNKGSDLDALADEVYSHLYTFFSRYYQEGDFLGLHRSTVHGRERYMIPYNGEEVKLVWANMDQYYIKSSELLRDYSFRIRKSDIASGELRLDDLPDESGVHFKLVEGDTEKDNRKADGKTTRAFALSEPPFEERDGSLWIYFTYREHPSERNLQDKLNTDTVKTLADSVPATWKTLLLADDPSYSGKDKKDTRSVLQKHLRSYTARHQFDYFIHKDLGGFLRRELDFYVKNEVMHLDDIEEAAAPKAEEYLSKIRALRRCALPVIRMIAQLEEFQKKLWLKKKFVVETRYCLTLDRVPEALYPEICANDPQWQEWEELVALSDLKPQRTVEFLKGNPHLMLDTRHLSREVTLKLLASIDDLDASLDGTCFHSENFQALQLMQERYRELIKTIAIDPPYNRQGDGFPYKDNYKHSSWASMMHDRMSAVLRMLPQDGALFANIDENEQAVLEAVLDSVFGSSNRIEELVWAQNTTHSQSPLYSTNHEYIKVYARNRSVAEASPALFREPKPGLKELLSLGNELNSRYAGLEEVETAIKALFTQHIEQYKLELETLDLKYDEDTKKQDPWRGLYNYCNAEYRGRNGQVVAEKTASINEARLVIWRESDSSAPAQKQSESTRNPDDKNFRFYKPTHPRTGNPCPHPKTGWRWPLTWVDESRESFESLDRAGRIVWGLDETKVPQYKRFAHEVETNVSKSFFHDYADGEKQIASLFGVAGLFPTPKPTTLPMRFISQTASATSATLDFFGGSGTTGHAVINLNREDDGRRKYILVEMGNHFATVLVPRLKKVAYSPDWKDGTPQTRNAGISHAFKIVRLESYEDALNNLHLRRSAEQEAGLKNSESWQQDDYLLGYFLDVESEGSASLLDLKQFRDPFSYKLNIATHSAGETQETAIDLVETFHWLLGLKVKTIDQQKGFLVITGEKRAGGRTLILWRKLSDDAKADNIALEAFLKKLAVNPADTEYEFIYVNGSHTLSDPHNKIHLTEEEFQRRMFETSTFESLS